MHIPDAYLSPATDALAYAIMVPLWVVGGKKTAKSLTSRQVPLLSIGSAFCFAIQMINVPAPGGTTAHALGASMLAILVGPWVALLGMTLTLAIQAVLFGDGGILSLGANCFDMAFVACFTGYGLFRLISSGASGGSKRWLIASAIGAYGGTVLASLSTGVLLGIQPVVAHDLTGHALYCPFGLAITVPAMVGTHLLVAGPVEAMITLSALAYVWRAFPEIIQKAPVRARRMRPALAWIVGLTPLGLLASGEAWGEWDADQIAKKVGYVPKGMADAHPFVRALLPDYALPNQHGAAWLVAGYLVSAALGCFALYVFIRLFFRIRPEVGNGNTVQSGIRPGTMLPSWMSSDEGPTSVSKNRRRSSWLDRTVNNLRELMAETLVTEAVAHKTGFLQAQSPLQKSIAFFAGLVLVSLVSNPLVLGALLSASLILGITSKVPQASFWKRVGESTLFFGLVIALPSCLQIVNPGTIWGKILGIPISGTGVLAGLTILLRLACGISIGLLWKLTTRWDHLIASLKAPGVPEIALATATLSYRYLFVIVDTLATMVEARRSREVGKISAQNARDYAGTGIAVLFAKSLVLTEEMHMAMQSRGFGDSLQRTPKKRIKTRPTFPPQPFPMPAIAAHAEGATCDFQP